MFRIILCLILIGYSFAGFSQKKLVINTGHSAGSVTKVLFSPDGELIATAGGDKKVIVWNTRTGRSVVTFNFEEYVERLFFSADGGFLIADNLDAIYRLDIATGQTAEIMDDVNGAVFYEPNSSMLYHAGGGADYGFGIRRRHVTQDESQLLTSTGLHLSQNIAVSPDQNYIVSYAQSGKEGRRKNNGPHLLLLNASGTVIQTIDRPGGDFKEQVMFSPDGNYFLSGGGRVYDHGKKGITAVEGNDNFILGRYNTSNGAPLKYYEGHTSQVVDMHVHPNGQSFISASANGEIKIWDTQLGTLIKDIKVECPVTSVAISPDGLRFVANFRGCDDQGLQMFDYNTGEMVQKFGVDILPVAKAIFADNKQKIVTKSFTDIKVWDVASGMVNEQLEVSRQWPKGQTDQSNENERLSELRRYMNSGSFFKSIPPHIAFETTFENYSKGSIQRYYKGGFYDITFSHRSNGQVLGQQSSVSEAIAFVDEDRFIMAGEGEEQNTVGLYSLSSGQLIRSFKGHENMIHHLAISPNREVLITVSRRPRTEYKFGVGEVHHEREERNIRAWNVATGEQIWSYSIDGSNLTVAFLKGGSHFVVWDGSRITLWDALKFKRVGAYRRNTKHSDLLFLEDQGIFLNTVDDKIEVLSMTGLYTEPIRSFEGHTADVNTINLSGDGQYLLSGSNDATSKIWDFQTGELLATMQTLNGDNKEYVIYTPDGFFDASSYMLSEMYYVEGLDIIPLESLYENFYTPNLLTRILGGERFEKPALTINDIDLPPLVEITSPDNFYNSPNKEVTLSISVTDQGGGVDEVKLYHNGKLVNTTQRGFKANASTVEFTIPLIAGENHLKATAFSEQRIEAVPDEIIVYYEGVRNTANLFLFVIGINQYRNGSYSLNYANSDALAFLKIIQSGASSIFNNIYVTQINDEAATKGNILSNLEKVQAAAGAEDMFVFYYAGHGVMNEGIDHVESVVLLELK